MTHKGELLDSVRYFVGFVGLILAAVFEIPQGSFQNKFTNVSMYV